MYIRIACHGEVTSFLDSLDDGTLTYKKSGSHSKEPTCSRPYTDMYIISYGVRSQMPPPAYDLTLWETTERRNPNSHGIWWILDSSMKIEVTFNVETYDFIHVSYTLQEKLAVLLEWGADPIAYVASEIWGANECTVSPLRFWCREWLIYDVWCCIRMTFGQRLHSSEDLQDVSLARVVNWCCEL